jgi:hypothetical protein
MRLRFCGGRSRGRADRADRAAITRSEANRPLQPTDCHKDRVAVNLGKCGQAHLHYSYCFAFSQVNNGFNDVIRVANRPGHIELF